jgi:hypothetical protein
MVWLKYTGIAELAEMTAEISLSARDGCWKSPGAGCRAEDHSDG